MMDSPFKNAVRNIEKKSFYEVSKLYCTKVCNARNVIPNNCQNTSKAVSDAFVATLPARDALFGNGSLMHNFMQGLSRKASG